MDINLPPRQHTKARKYRWFLAGLACLILSLAVFWYQSNSVMGVARHSLIIDTAKRGPLTLQVEAFGKLKSARQQIITTPSAGIIVEVVRKAGQSVKKGEVIATLKNDDLALQLTQMQQQLEALKIQYEIDKIRQHREMLTEQATLDRMMGKLSTLQIRYRAQHELAKQGIVSQFSFLQTQAERDSMKRRIGSAQARMSQLHTMHSKELAITKNKVSLKELELVALHRKVAALTIRAPSDGVIEQMPLAVGENVQSGGYIASIGNQKELTAVLQVAQSEAQKIKLGQRVKVMIRNTEVAAFVTRIDPVVTNHSVLVEAALPSDLPTSTMPKMSVEAAIIIENLQDVVYIRRPSSQSTVQNGRLYRVLGADRLELINVEFGEQTGRYIVVEQGLQAGQSVIISDLNHLVQQSTTLEMQ
ncbi:hypothetical protein A7985_23065 [Pseudoalteromonas luteoviolacea]|uniref:Uncharacterized protein n=1 Tax=Pseudoalteromonas luteoviolacea TaxID=43657 RepID=A0A1C0TJR7_9GAMM|nr:HlyD family efflux transporter periplasmic adaptor subunit [Pseudoalteromonas luteoviolacea]OCQ18769.1 hypothetical protein A7985_23065 [Pseudoalteromonas luteoviolacea]